MEDDKDAATIREMNRSVEEVVRTVDEIIMREVNLRSQDKHQDDIRKDRINALKTRIEDLRKDFKDFTEEKSG